MWHLWVEKNSPMGKDQQRFLAHILTSNNEEKVIKVFLLLHSLSSLSNISLMTKTINFYQRFCLSVELRFAAKVQSILEFWREQKAALFANKTFKKLQKMFQQFASYNINSKANQNGVHLWRHVLSCEGI